MENEQVRNVIRDTRKDVRYEILAPRKLNREEMLQQVKIFHSDSLNLRQKTGTTVEIIVKE